MKLNVAVIFGGKSTEHDISIISAHQTIENIDKEKYNVIPVYISKTGDFYYSKDGLLLDMKNYKNQKDLISKCRNISFVKIKNHTYIRDNKVGIFGDKIDQEVDVVFLVVHGTNVEDGNLQGYFHTLNLPIVGSDVLASAISMDKYVMKEYWKAIGIPVIDGIRFDKKDYKNVNSIVDKVENELGYPVIVKPVNLGSSIGIKKGNDKQSLIDALELAFSFTDLILVEKAIVNMREINCAVLGDKFECETSELEEPFGNDEILSFADKYMSGGGAKGAKSGAKVGADANADHIVRGDGVGAKQANVGAKLCEPAGAKSGMASLKRKIPAELEESVANKIREYAIKAFKYMGCSGVARIDFIIDKDNGNIYANEINAIPGSLSYYLFEPKGITFKELADRLINIAIENYKREERLNYTFESSVI